MEYNWLIKYQDGTTINIIASEIWYAINHKDVPQPFGNIIFIARVEDIDDIYATVIELRDQAG